MAVTKDRSSAPAPVVNGPTKHSTIWPLEFYRSAVGKKWVMAITGLLGVGFVVMHMIGNLKDTTLKNAEQARHLAAQTLEQGESTLAAYRRVVKPTLASATLVNRRG